MYGQWICETALFVYDYHAKFKPVDLLHQVQKHKITTFCAPPTIYRFLIQEDLSDIDFSSLTHCSTAGEPLSEEVFNKWKEITGLEIKGNISKQDKEVVILMIDDICSYGGTFYYSSKALKEKYPNVKIYSYATHTENVFPRLVLAMDEGLIEEHFTTDSYLGSTKYTHPKITILC